jgi:hypothetical protein
MNPQRDRGIRTEREACALLVELTGHNVRRRANEGIREDIGDLIGLPDTTIQVSRVPDQPAAINNRARTKLADLALQQQRAATRHGVVLLRIDGAGARPGVWRALVDSEGLDRLHGQVAHIECVAWPPSSGWVIRHAPDMLTGGWHEIGVGNRVTGRYVATIETWAADYLAATRTTV